MRPPFSRAAEAIVRKLFVQRSEISLVPETDVEPLVIPTFRIFPLGISTDRAFDERAAASSRLGLPREKERDA